MIIETTIRTPQFKSDGSVKNYKTQFGTIDTETWIFEPKEPSGHKVHCHSESNYLKVKVK